DFNLAVRALKQAIVLTKDGDPRAQYFLGRAYYGVRNYPLAIAAYKECLRGSHIPGDLRDQALYRLANSQFYLREFTQALELLKMLRPGRVPGEYISRLTAACELGLKDTSSSGKSRTTKGA